MYRLVTSLIIEDTQQAQDTAWLAIGVEMHNFSNNQQGYWHSTNRHSLTYCRRRERHRVSPRCTPFSAVASLPLAAHRVRHHKWWETVGAAESVAGGDVSQTRDAHWKSPALTSC